MQNSTSKETAMLFKYLAKKSFFTALRWSICIVLGIVAWILFDPLPPAFLWMTMLTMLGAMSLHTILYQKKGIPKLALQTCRYFFFLSIPMLFVFGGNRLAVWSTTNDSAAVLANDISAVRGAIPSEDYLKLKEIKKEGFSDPVKAKKEVKQFLSKQLQKAKQMDKGTRTLFIIFGILLALVILFLVLLFVGINQTINGCAGGEDNNGCL